MGWDSPIDWMGRRVTGSEQRQGLFFPHPRILRHRSWFYFFFDRTFSKPSKKNAYSTLSIFTHISHHYPVFLQGFGTLSRVFYNTFQLAKPILTITIRQDSNAKDLLNIFDSRGRRNSNSDEFKHKFSPLAPGRYYLPLTTGSTWDDPMTSIHAQLPMPLLYWSNY